MAKRGDKNMSEKYCVMNMKKNKRADVKHIQKEANRELEEYKNDVKKELTHTNYYFVKTDDWNEKITEILEENGLEENDKSVVLITSVYSASPEWFKDKSRDEVIAYFEKCLEFEQRKGEVINAVIHFDETTPHMQVATVPVVDVPTVMCSVIPKRDEKGNVVLDDEGNEVPDRDKKGRLKYKRTRIMENGQMVTHKGLSAKTVFGNKVKMSKTQTEFYEMCGKPFGLERGEIRVEDAETAKEHLTEAQYKAEQIIKDAEVQAQAVKDKAIALARANMDYITQRTLELQTQEDDLKAREDVLKAQKDDLQSKQEEIQAKEEKALKSWNDAVNAYSEYAEMCREQEMKQAELQKREDALQVREQNYKKNLQAEAQKEVLRHKLNLKAVFDKKYRDYKQECEERVQEIADFASEYPMTSKDVEKVLDYAFIRKSGDTKLTPVREYLRTMQEIRHNSITSYKSLPDVPYDVKDDYDDEYEF